MTGTQRFEIPYESLDPLTIGAADDESKVYRDTLELEIAEANLLAAIYPDEPDPSPTRPRRPGRRSRPRGRSRRSRSCSRAASRSRS